MNVFGVGPTEIIVVLIIILVLFGPDKLPEMAKRIGGASREIRDNLKVVNEQMNSALEASMDLDKARMIPPAEVAPVAEPETPPAPETPPQVQAPENHIMPDDSGAQTILPPPADKTMPHA